MTTDRPNKSRWKTF